MNIIPHHQRPSIVVPRITTRKIATPADGAATLEMWEQIMPPGGHIPPHYHECEELITFIQGLLTFSLGEAAHEIHATPDCPTTIFIPPRVVHHAVNASEAEVHLLAVFAETEPRVFLPDGTLIRLPWQEREGEARL